MKKVFFSLFTFLFFAGFITAQDSPAKAYKAAKSAFNKYKVESDEAKKGDKMQTAVQNISYAITNIDQADDKIKVKIYLLGGDIYNEMVQKDAQMQLIDKEHVIANPESAMKAYEAYSKAYDMASKKYEVKEASVGLKNAASSLTSVGNMYLTAQDYKKAYVAMNTILKIHEQTKAKGEPLILADEKELNDQIFYVAICARLVEDNDAAKKLFKRLIDSKYDNAQIYSNYASLIMEEDEKKALEILAQGRKLYPNDSEILFGEINYYIQKQEYSVLEEKLTLALEAAPNNASVPSALGNVYMTLFQKEYEAGNIEQADKYFADAKKYFEKSLEIDPKMFDAVYSIGSLYYNKAVEITKAMNALGNTKAEMKKYSELQTKTKALFSEALPYFKKAEKMNPNDRSTLIALKEIFARNDDFTTSNEFKKRLETVEGGGKIDSPYFK